MTIKETSLEVLVALGNYENIKLSVTGDNIDELREYLIDSLNNFGSGDPEIKHRINSYITRVLEKPDLLSKTEGNAKCDTYPNPNSEIESGGFINIEDGARAMLNAIKEKPTCEICGKELSKTEERTSLVLFNKKYCDKHINEHTKKRMEEETRSF